MKNRDSSLPHATGRAGSASIEAFALLPFEMGDTASIHLRFSDGTHYWDVNPSMTLQPFSYRYEQPAYCYSDGFCSGSLDARSGKLGSDSSANQ